MTFTGVLTTSGSLIAVIAQLARHPEYTSELLEEQNDIGDNLDSAAYKRMVKLDSFIRESFRYTTDTIFHPHTNVTKENVVLSNGSIIRPGEEVYTNFWDLNRGHKAQDDFDDLDTFKPFRYVGLNKQATKCSSDYLFFGLGR
ncbi:cytochrome P450 [Fennellomyces sp. T-0311]|nr:cytochrome P450 [Fennellomyces sp. T-0311]